MNVKTFNRLAHTITLIVFLMASALYAAEDSRSFFKDKKVDHKKLSTESEDRILQKKTMLKAKGGKVPVRKRLDKRILSAHLEDLSGIHIPQNMGRVVEVYQSPSSESRLIVHIQDLHTNPEAQLNEAGILDALIKDYGLSLVCSEGAEGKVDTSSVSSFPDPEVRKKTALLFINSGELTAEEYLSITKYPDLPIWGIEDKDVYFKNIIQFNKIMRFNPKSLELISKIQNSLEGVKDKIFSKELLALEAKEKDYEEENIETEEYLEHITGYMEGLNIATSNYKNIALLNETMGREEDIDQEKIMQESQALVMRLEEELSNKYLKKEKNSLLAQAQLFKNEKISAFSFYSYLKEYSDKYLPDGLSAYPHLEGFVDYLVKINELDATKLFNEIDELTHEVKNRLASTKEEKDLIHASRNIKFLEDFFNLEISNEELDYYLSDKGSFGVAWFKDIMVSLRDKIASSSLIGAIDFDPELIDEHLEGVEEFYLTVKKRDVAMAKNALAEIEKRDAKVAAFISGGFHTQGVTKSFKEKGYSYIVVIPYSSTEIDEENYRYLLSGKRKPITELLEELDSSGEAGENKADDLGLNSNLRVPLQLGEGAIEKSIKELAVEAQDRLWEELNDRSPNAGDVVHEDQLKALTTGVIEDTRIGAWTFLKKEGTEVDARRLVERSEDGKSIIRLENRSGKESLLAYNTLNMLRQTWSEKYTRDIGADESVTYVLFYASDVWDNMNAFKRGIKTLREDQIPIVISEHEEQERHVAFYIGLHYLEERVSVKTLEEMGLKDYAFHRVINEHGYGIEGVSHVRCVPLSTEILGLYPALRKLI